MREIKFRGRRVDNGEWVEGSLITKITPKEVEPVFWTTLIHDGALTAVEVDPATVGQFTGEVDAGINGVEVYEGDIIENCDTKELQIVYWNDGQAAWYCRYVADKNRKVSLANSLGNLNKVIGNIHENPELIA